jgi:hypothetical protein
MSSILSTHVCCTFQRENFSTKFCYRASSFRDCSCHHTDLQITDYSLNGLQHDIVHRRQCIVIFTYSFTMDSDDTYVIWKVEDALVTNNAYYKWLLPIASCLLWWPVVSDLIPIFVLRKGLSLTLHGSAIRDVDDDEGM